MATEAPRDMQDARDLLLASIDQAHRLTQLVNEGLFVPESSQEPPVDRETDTASAPDEQAPTTPDGASAESIASSTSTLTADTSEGVTIQESLVSTYQQTTPRRSKRAGVPVTVPADPVIGISTRLNQQLTQLLVSTLIITTHIYDTSLWPTFLITFCMYYYLIIRLIDLLDLCRQF